MKPLKLFIKRYVVPLRHPRAYFSYWLSLHRYRTAGGAVSNFWPVLGEATKKTAIDPHYFYQGAWAARLITQAKPAEHLDVGSQVDLVGYLTAVTNVTSVDIRPLRIGLPGLTVRHGTILALPFPDNSLPSVSCLHVAEHIGLGRYGDPLDPRGAEKACAELARVLAVGGSLYFSLPIGRERTEFNAHRVHRPATILRYFSGLTLTEFSAVGDDKCLIRNADIGAYDDARYACGLFRFTKNSAN
jgi:SAM-dependent methyltransferase